MENDLQKKIEERLAELPEMVRAAVLSEDTGAKIRAISANHQLHIDQAATLEDATMLVMLGFIPTEKFSDEIQRQLLIPKESADKIIADIETDIFLPIRETMKKSGETPKTASIPTPVTTPTTPIVTTPTTPTSISTPPPGISMPSVEQHLTERTAVVAPAPTTTQATQPKPIYKADPYREPIE